MEGIKLLLFVAVLVCSGEARHVYNTTDDVVFSVDFYIPDGQWNMTAEGEYMAAALRRPTQRSGYRPGQATRSHSCGHVRGVPGELRSASVMKPSGLSSFYQKYTEAYGIPVLGSYTVSDNALKRACYTLRFALADRADVRQSFYRSSGRVAIIARSERTTQIPEYSSLDSAYWDNRARGLGATTGTPISTGAEENVLCDSSDPWHNEDIFLHELSHGVDNLGATLVISGWKNRVNSAFNSAKSSGRWANTYAGSNPTEYYAEGVVTYFNDQAEANPGDGIHNYVNTRSELRSYDTGLVGVIEEIYPCNNNYLHRCSASRAQEEAQQLRMDCGGHATTGGGGTGGSSSGGSGCSDDDSNCNYWASTGRCTDSYASYMQLHCRRSCNLCGGGGGGSSSSSSCSDNSENCGYWASTGECSNNPAYMLQNCKHSCGSCGGAVGR